MKANQKATLSDTKKSKRFLLNTSASAATEVVNEVVGISIIVIIGILIFVEVNAAIPGASLTNASNTTIATVESTFYSALTLVVIALIVLAAVLIISIVQRIRG